MKIGTIGSGAIVDQAYDAFSQIQEIEPAAVYSRTMEKAKAFAQKHGVKKAYDSLDDLFGDPELDAIYIASPNSLHYPQAKAALQAGKHVMLEKPFASNSAQAKDLFELAESKGLMIFEAITSLHTVNFHLLRQNMERAGKIRQCLFDFSQYSRRYTRYMEGIVDNVFNPDLDGGALVDINVYNIHLAIALFGKPQEIIYKPLIGWNGIDTSGVLLLVYPELIITCIGAKDSSSDYLGTIQGELGTFRITNGSTGKMSYIDFIEPVTEHGQAKPSVISIDQGLHMIFEFIDFYDAISGQDTGAYEECKKQTLAVMEVLDEAKAQRDAAARAKQNKTE